MIPLETLRFQHMKIMPYGSEMSSFANPDRRPILEVGIALSSLLPRRAKDQSA